MSDAWFDDGQNLSIALYQGLELAGTIGNVVALLTVTHNGSGGGDVDVNHIMDPYQWAEIIANVYADALKQLTIDQQAAIIGSIIVWDGEDDGQRR